MDCVEFERVFVRVMTDEVSSSERSRCVEQLKKHAASCNVCSGSRDLVEWLAWPTGEREIAEDPGEAYWRGLGQRVGDRIERRPPTATGRRGGRYRWAGVAAVLLAVGLGAWVLWAPAGRVATVVEIDPVDTTEEIPRALVELIERETASPDGVLPMGAEGWGSSLEDEGWIFPDTQELGPDGRRELLEWLREQTPHGAEVPS
jgi:hypothetical protein